MIKISKPLNKSENIFKNKDILVTGGCGSIGSEIVKQLLKYDPKRVRVFDNSEHGHFKLNQQIKSDKIRNLIGDVRDINRVMRAMEGVDIVFHAAALKHVPFCEYNPFEAVSTNVMGTQNLVEAAMNQKVKIFVGISTDKAVNPTCTLGATKLLAEKIITNIPGATDCKFCCVRFGNVLNSVGSVIPIFQHQIEHGGPLTITSNEMTRFFMGIDDAVNLVLKSAELTTGGEVFILKMDALRIKDLAQVMIEELAPKHGYKPKDIKINYIGVRPGEKIDEILLTPEEVPYVADVGEMFILYNSLLSGYGKGKLSGVRAKYSDYTSKNAPMLKPQQIKEVLIKKSIL